MPVPPILLTHHSRRVGHDQGQQVLDRIPAGRGIGLGEGAHVRRRQRGYLPVRLTLMPVTPDVVLTICVSSRLAPQDHHRFHSPVDGVLGNVTDIPGQYYTGASIVSTMRHDMRKQSDWVRWFSEPASGERTRLRRLHRQQALRAPHDALAVECAITFVAVGAMLVRSASLFPSATDVS